MSDRRVGEDALAALAAGGVHALHDATEGGVLGHFDVALPGKTLRRHGN